LDLDPLWLSRTVIGANRQPSRPSKSASHFSDSLIDFKR
jgi:hypothetical protein